VPSGVLVLASASPRRAELLRTAGIPFDVIPADVDERQHEGEEPDTYVCRLASEKAARVAIAHPGRPVLGADTTVVVDGEVLGKPRDPDDAVSMLGRLSGRSHLVLTGVCLIDAGGGAETALATTTVEFRPLTPAEIAGYVASGEPMDKAGAYAIQGLAGGFVTRIHGAYDNVVGLPVALIQAMCRARGIQVS
jgi:septum formation protein